MKSTKIQPRNYLYPLLVAIAALALWAALSASGVFPHSAFPAPMEVLAGIVDEVKQGRMFQDIIASLFRVTTGFVLAVALGIPLGLGIGLHAGSKAALLPFVNFFRSLSPLAWIPFAILWFGVGDVPSIFLIFMSVFFPVVISTTAAVASIPSVHFRVGRDYGLRGIELLTQVTIPAIMPQIITTLRVTAGLAWLVVVAAEMIAGRDGLGFLIWDARNGLRNDLVVVGMVVIGLIGIALDRILMQMTRIPSVRWGYER
jgi:NitT/TauT family transport system permease protein